MSVFMTLRVRGDRKKIEALAAEDPAFLQKIVGLRRAPGYP